ncbi:signal peptidase I [Spirilliplanes yamanashiensis]|uniref:Signal peptidase I n=1 Tax=Spirilliplanes yamanashiensis TaxID=42233 RepID=A0A8J3Y6B3_9ACTN|nr:signal peptidase I [Spirilliplanes yamanashiensis]MDP9815001.1 signal peptidase [Spirilliplanes yamanashiensis]GIJ02656.1 hypothetical protein Sya03_20080 [Spirilliplanes yamanashiensis]
MTAAPAGRTRRLATTALMLVMVAAAAAVTLGRVAGLQPLVEQSGSMLPTIRPGALVVSRPVPADAVRTGDIVSFRDTGRGGALITHRVVDVRRTGDLLTFETRGDANAGSERWTAPARAEIGRTVVVLPYLGMLVAGLAEPLVVACLAAVAGLLVAAVLAGRRGRHGRRRGRAVSRPRVPSSSGTASAR